MRHVKLNNKQTHDWLECAIALNRKQMNQEQQMELIMKLEGNKVSKPDDAWIEWLSGQLEAAVTENKEASRVLLAIERSNRNKPEKVLAALCDSFIPSDSTQQQIQLLKWQNNENMKQRMKESIDDYHTRFNTQLAMLQATGYQVGQDEINTKFLLGMTQHINGYQKLEYGKKKLTPLEIINQLREIKLITGNESTTINQAHQQ